MYVKKLYYRQLPFIFPTLEKSIQNLKTTTYLAIILNMRDISTSEHSICGR